MGQHSKRTIKVIRQLYTPSKHHPIVYTMEYQNLLTELRDGILIVTINRPKALNALNKQTFSDLKQLFEVDALQIEGLKGVVITGAGEKSFVAGADITEFQSLNAAEMEALSRRGQGIFRSIETFPKAVIAAVNGYALGGGCELAMACHMRVAGEKARFGQPEVNLGIVPGYGGTQRLTELVGRAKALEFLLTADMVRAEEAVRLGLANHMVAKGEEVAKAIEIINKIAAKAPIAIAKTIAAVDAYFDKNKDGYDAEAVLFGECADTEDFKEGYTAFLEKRQANFIGQ